MSRGLLASVYSTNTISSFRAVFTTSRDWKQETDSKHVTACEKREKERVGEGGSGCIKIISK